MTETESPTGAPARESLPSRTTKSPCRIEPRRSAPSRPKAISSIAFGAPSGSGNGAHARPPRSAPPRATSSRSRLPRATRRTSGPPCAEGRPSREDAERAVLRRAGGVRGRARRTRGRRRASRPCRRAASAAGSPSSGPAGPERGRAALREARVRPEPDDPLPVLEKGPDPRVREPLRRAEPLERRRAVPPERSPVARGDPDASPLRLADDAGDVPAREPRRPRRGARRPRTGSTSKRPASVTPTRSPPPGPGATTVADRRGSPFASNRVSAPPGRSRARPRVVPAQRTPSRAWRRADDLRSGQVAYRRHRLERRADGRTRRRARPRHPRRACRRPARGGR